MKKIGLCFFLALFHLGCSVKSKGPVHQHKDPVANKQASENGKNRYKEQINTEDIYKKAAVNGGDKVTEVVRPIAAIVLNTKHLDDPYLYNANDLRYALQVFQMQFINALKTQPDKVQDTIQDYLKFLNYKCTANHLTDCKSHVFLKQDSSTSGVILMIARTFPDIEKKMELLSTAIALQNAGNGENTKKEILLILADYIKANTVKVKGEFDESIEFKDNKDESIKKFKKNVATLFGYLKSFNIEDQEIQPLEPIVLLKNSNKVLGEDLYSFIFTFIAKKNISSGDNKLSNEQLLNQWYKILQNEEKNNPFSWSRLKTNLPGNIKIQTTTVDEFKSQGLAALVLYQTAQDLSAQKALKELEVRKEFVTKNPDLALKVFETQLKLHFFSLAQQSFKILKTELANQQEENNDPAELFSLILRRSNDQLRPIWSGYSKVIDHYESYIKQNFSSSSATAMKFAELKNKLLVNNKVLVSMPLMLMFLHYIDKKQYKETLKIGMFSNITVELDAPLALYEVLLGRLPSLFFLIDEKKELGLSQYQILYSLAFTIQTDLPQYMGVTRQAFLEAFAKANGRVALEKMEKHEKSLEEIGFGPFDQNMKYRRQDGIVHEALRFCENTRSQLVPLKLNSLVERTVYGSLDSMDFRNTQLRAFSTLAFDSMPDPTAFSIDEKFELIRSEIDPYIDLLVILEKVGGLELQNLKNTKLRRDKMIERLVELEKKVTSCGLKLDKLERDRQKRFLARENKLVKKIMAMAHWIDSGKVSEALPQELRSQTNQSKEKKLQLAQEWMVSIYNPLKQRAPGLYEEIKNFQFFDLSSFDQKLSINSRSLDSYYRLAMWLEEPEQQNEVRVAVTYEETFDQVKMLFYSHDATGNFESVKIEFDSDDNLLERTLRQKVRKVFHKWYTGAAFQFSLRNILKQKAAKWKMATSLDWNFINWIECNKECREKRKEVSRKELEDAIQTNLSFLDYFNITPEDEEELKGIGVISKVNIDSQIEGSLNIGVKPDYLFTYSVAVLATDTTRDVNVGYLDYFFRYATSLLLGQRPLYSLFNGFFNDSGREKQSPMNEEEIARNSQLQAKDLYTRRVLPLDLQPEHGIKEDRIIELRILGNSINESLEQQYLISLGQNVDRSIRAYIAAPILRELELREILFEAVKRNDLVPKDSIRFTLVNPPVDNPWLVSVSYVGRVQELEEKFHEFTKNAFTLKKWYGDEEKKK